MSHKKEIQHIAEDFANAGYNASKEEFLLQMRMLHRTHQQIFAGLVLAWMQDYATYPVDERNHYSVEYYTRIIDAFDAVNPGEPLRKGFPLV